MSGRLASTEQRICSDCSASFATDYPQRLCNPCKYARASRSTCETCGRKTGNTGRTRCRQCWYGPTPVIRAMTPMEVAWLAAVIEGEGTFVITERRCAVQVPMTDKDVIERLHGLSGIGTVVSLVPRAAHHRPGWRWQVVRQANVSAVAAAVAPWLLSRRREAAGVVLGRYGQDPPSPEVPVPGTPESWAWIAGLIEGEGWLGPGPDSVKRHPDIRVSSTDRDVIDRLESLTGAGHVRTLPLRRAHWKPSWEWEVSDRVGVRGVLTSILPHMGERRSERARYILGQMA